MAKIAELTQEQIDRFPEFRDKWIEIGLCTEPANRKEAERGIQLAYKCAGLEPPRRIVWTSSPLSNSLTRVITCEILREQNYGNIRRDSVGDSVWGSVGDSVWGSVGDSVWDSVKGRVWDGEDVMRFVTRDREPLPSKCLKWAVKRVSFSRERMFT